MINAILYVLKGGIPASLLPEGLSTLEDRLSYLPRLEPWTHTWAALGSALRLCLRAEAQRHQQPSAAILDSQSVKSDGHGGRVGYDAGKKIKGRKRHLLVDTLGLILGAVVTPASCPERDGAQQVLQRVGGWFPRLRKLWVDGGYTGEAFAQWVRAHWPKLAVEVVKRSAAAQGFQAMPHRWSGRTHVWLAHAPSPTRAGLRAHRGQR